MSVQVSGISGQQEDPGCVGYEDQQAQQGMSAPRGVAAVPSEEVDRQYKGQQAADEQ
jgi:hypothetical protein